MMMMMNTIRLKVHVAEALTCECAFCFEHDTVTFHFTFLFTFKVYSHDVAKIFSWHGSCPLTKGKVT